MATNIPPLVGEPSKRQASVVNWVMIGSWLAANTVLPIALQLKQLFSKPAPQPTEEKK